MLNKKICFITGGSRGIGRTIVNSFLENNAIVVFTYLENENSANDLFEEVEKNTNHDYYFIRWMSQIGYP